MRIELKVGQKLVCSRHDRIHGMPGFYYDYREYSHKYRIGLPPHFAFDDVFMIQQISENPYQITYLLYSKDTDWSTAVQIDNWQKFFKLVSINVGKVWRSFNEI